VSWPEEEPQDNRPSDDGNALMVYDRLPPASSATGELVRIFANRLEGMRFVRTQHGGVNSMYIILRRRFVELVPVPERTAVWSQHDVGCEVRVTCFS
jgi:hypothetical protein